MSDTQHGMERMEVDESKPQCSQESYSVDSNSTNSAKDSLTSDSKPLSKRAMKKQLKKLMWLDIRQEKRKIERLKRKEAKKRFKALKASGEISEEATSATLRSSKLRKFMKSNVMKNSECKVGVAVDMSFEKYMSEQEIAKCIKQVHRCYSINRKFQNPLQYFVTSFPSSGPTFDCIERNNGWKHWDVNFTEKHFSELEYPKNRIVYLTSDSKNVLHELQNENLYVIGGIVDHNNHKGLCYELSQKYEVQHARLPIDEYINMKTRKVLTIDHVFHILHKVAHGTSWKDAFLEVIPERKNANEKKLSHSKEKDKVVNVHTPGAGSSDK